MHLGLVRAAARDYPAATGCHQRALELFRDVGDRSGQVFALGDLGAAHAQAGRHHQASTSLMGALALFRDLGNQYGEAGTLDRLGVLSTD